MHELSIWREHQASYLTSMLTMLSQEICCSNIKHPDTTRHEATSKALQSGVISNGTGNFSWGLKIKQLCKGIKIPNSNGLICGHCGQITTC